MAASLASQPMVVDDGNKGLDQSIHNPSAGNSQFNAAATPETPHAPHNAPPETPAPQNIREMKEWKFLSSLIEKDGTEIAIRAAAKDFLQAIRAQEPPEAGAQTNANNNKNNAKKRGNRQRQQQPQPHPQANAQAQARAQGQPHVPTHVPTHAPDDVSASTIRQLIREEIQRALTPSVTQNPQATQATQIPQAAQATQNPPAAQAGSGPRTWAEKAKTASNARSQLRTAKPPQNPNPVRELRQITIRGKDIAPKFKDRSAAETVLAVNKEGGKGGCRAANKLPSGDIRLTFDANTKEWHTQNTAWVTKVFGSPQALGVKTFAVLAKGIPQELLGAPLRQTAEEMGEANAVTIYRARAKVFRHGAPTVGLLLEFTAVA